MKAVDFDSNENILIAGISHDTSLMGSMTVTSNFKPFVGFISACEYQWLNTFNSLEGHDITTAKFNNDASLAAFSTEVKDDQIIRTIIRVSDGGIVATYQKCHSSTYASGRSAALSLQIFGPENDYRMFTAEPSSTTYVFCKFTPTGI